MSWSDIYLVCFIVGFSLSVLSFLAGAVHIHLPFKMHFPFHGGLHGGGMHGHGHAGGSVGKAGMSHTSGQISWFNASSATAFLAWFGGIGYILSVRSHLVSLVALTFAILGGLVASWVVFKFMVRLMNAEGSELRDEDFRLEGQLCTVTMPIRANGTGEVIFMQNGARRSAGAKSHDGQALEKGAEVVIERYENGTAYVHRWEEFSS